MGPAGAPFAAEHRVIALDNRGAGQSDAPATPYTISGMAADAGHLHFIEQADRFNALGLEFLEKHRGA